MDKIEVGKFVEKQREFFASGATLDVNFRLQYLKKLRTAIKDNLPLIHDGLKKDLGKSESESYMCETGLALCELSYLIKHVKKFAKVKRVKTPLAQYPSKSYRLPCPYGTVLISSPWNYPFLLAIDPLAEAIAAGNTAVLNLSEYSPNTNAALHTVLKSVFPEEYVKVFFGGTETNNALTDVKFDYIFFTGSKRVGTLIYENAAKTLTPVTLELGGKSPCIVDETANIPLAAKRIVWGKFLNLGQTCVAPDYILCSEKIHGRLVAEIKKQITLQFGESPLSNPNYGKIISERHYRRLVSLIIPEKTVCGGVCRDAELRIEPTVMDNVSFDDAVMQEEIFGPILPVIPYADGSVIKRYISEHDAPLALYVFSSDKKRIKDFTTTLGFGGGCINDVVIHLATPYMPFGGFKESGLGSYHGKTGFDTFTHYKSIVNKKTFVDLPARYQPYKKSHDKIAKMFLK